MAVLLSIFQRTKFLHHPPGLFVTTTCLLSPSNERSFVTHSLGGEGYSISKATNLVILKCLGEPDRLSNSRIFMLNSLTASRKIQDIANALRLSEVVCLAATRLYTLAVEHKFTKGCKGMNVVPLYRLSTKGDA